MLGESLENALAYPPHCIRDELETTGFIEFLGCLDESEIAFVDKVGKAEALVLVLFGYRYHEAEVGAGKLFERRLVTFAYALGEFYFLLGAHEFLAAYLLKIFIEGSAFAVGNGFSNL